MNAEQIAKLNLGRIYFKFNEEEQDFIYIRVIKLESDGYVIIRHLSDSSETRERLIDIKKEYSPLAPYGVMTVSKVYIGYAANGARVPDVVTLFYKYRNKGINYNDPDILCRQAMSDIFYIPYCTTEVNPMVGFSVTKESLPPEFKSVNELSECDEVEESIAINVYITDTLDSLCEIIGDRYDDILYGLLKTRFDYLKSFNAISVSELDEPPDTLDGYCKTLKLLYKTNNFIQDVYDANNIIKVDFEIVDNEDVENNVLDQEQKETLEMITRQVMDKTIYMKYSYEINLSALKVYHVLVMDRNDTLFIVCFTKSSEEFLAKVEDYYENDYDKIRKRILEAIGYYDKYTDVTINQF